METAITAALVSAAVSLAVALYNRVSARSDERRRWELVDRRAVYLRFLSAAYEEHLGESDIVERDNVASQNAQLLKLDALLLAFAEVQLIASPDVGAAAGAVVTHAVHFDSQPVEDERRFAVRQLLHSAFASAARADLGYSPLPGEAVIKF